MFERYESRFFCVCDVVVCVAFVRLFVWTARLSDARVGVKRVSSRRRFKTGLSVVSRGAVLCGSFSVVCVFVLYHHGEDARDVLF